MLVWWLTLLLGRMLAEMTRAPPVVGPKTLVVLPDLAQKQTYLTFLKSLKGAGHTLEFKTCKEKGYKLVSFGKTKYTNAVVFCPHVTVSELSSKKLVEFNERGGNLLVGLDAQPTDTWRKFAMANGWKLHSKSTRVQDHFHSDGEGGVLTTNWLQNEGIFPSSELKDTPVVFDSETGTSMSGRKNAHWAVSLLSASNAGFSANPESEALDTTAAEAVGQNVVLVGALEGKNGARVTMAGTVSLFADRTFNTAVTNNFDGTRYAKPANAAFAAAVGEWAFGRRGYLRVTNRRHFQQQDNSTGTVTLSPTTYRIADDVEYRFDLEEFRRGEWVPYGADNIEFEFIRLDPFVRQLAVHEGEGKYSVKFRVPDTFGVYKFSVKYNRRGYTTMHFDDMVSVRPFAHNEYDRFLVVAYPYYAGAFAMLGGFLVFSWVFLHHVKDGGGKKKD